MNPNANKLFCFIFAFLISFSFVMAHSATDEIEFTQAQNETTEMESLLIGMIQEKEYTVTLGPSTVNGQFRKLTVVGGSIEVDGLTFDLFLQKEGPYPLKKPKGGPSTMVYVDYDRNGLIGYYDETWTTDYPIRFGNKMLAVKSIAADGRTMVLVEVDIPVKGLVIGQRAPDFELTDMDGKKHTLSDYQGKYLLLDIWSQSCGPCIGKMPDIRELQQELGTDKLDVLLLSTDYGREGSGQGNRDILKKMDLPWPNVLVPNSFKGIAELFNASGYGLWLISPEGKVLVAHGRLNVIRDAIK